MLLPLVVTTIHMNKGTIMQARHEDQLSPKRTLFSCWVLACS